MNYSSKRSSTSAKVHGWPAILAALGKQNSAGRDGDPADLSLGVLFMATVQGHTGQRCQVAGIYAGNHCAQYERTFPLGHVFPPCPRCHASITWMLVRATHIK